MGPHLEYHSGNMECWNDGSAAPFQCFAHVSAATVHPALPSPVPACLRWCSCLLAFLVPEYLSPPCLAAAALPRCCLDTAATVSTLAPGFHPESIPQASWLHVHLRIGSTLETS